MNVALLAGVVGFLGIAYAFFLVSRGEGEAVQITPPAPEFSPFDWFGGFDAVPASTTPEIVPWDWFGGFADLDQEATPNAPVVDTPAFHAPLYEPASDVPSNPTLVDPVSPSTADDLFDADPTYFSAYDNWVWPAEAPSTPPPVRDSIDAMIADASAAYGIRPELIRAVCKVESGFNPNAQSASSSARGLMQLTKAAAKDVGVDHDALFDPRTNIMAGTAYLQRCIRLAGSERRGVEAYYAGIGTVSDAVETKLDADGRRYADKVFSYA